MIYLLWFLSILALIFGMVPFLMTYQFRRYSRREIADSPQATSYTPKTTLIIPCKGTDLNFETHIRSFLLQDYPNYEVIFVTATNDDPAYGEIRRIIQSTPQAVPTKLLVAGIEPGRGQKMTNMLKGVANAASDVEVLAFMDADIDIYPGLLQKLVQPLQRSDVGAASGIWVFLPIQKAFGSILKFVWGSGAILMASDKNNNLAIAAVTCMKKEIYDRANIHQRLQNTVSDTMAFTQGVKELGLSVHFVPEALIISEDHSNSRDVLAWTNRLAIFNRVYNRAFWWKVFFVFGVQNFLIVAGFVSLVMGSMGADIKIIIPGLVMVGLVGLQILHAAVTFPVIVRLLNKYPSAQRDFQNMKWKMCLLAPLGGILSMLNSFNSLRTNIITWRGIQYRLISSNETEVIGEIK